MICKFPARVSSNVYDFKNETESLLLNLLIFEKGRSDLLANAKITISNVNITYTVLTLSELSKILKSGPYQTLSKLSSFSISSLLKLDEEANKLYVEKIIYTKQLLILNLTTLDTLSKFHSLIKLSNSLIYLAYLDTIQWYHLFLLISKIFEIRNYYQSVIQYLKLNGSLLPPYKIKIKPYSVMFSVKRTII